MSILLDALRKSEQQKKLGTAPDIYSVEPLTTPRRRRPAWLVPAAAVVAVALVLAGGYAAWQVYFQPAPLSPGAPVPDTGTAAPLPELQNPPANGDASAEPPQPSGAATETAPRIDTQPRSPVESLTGERPYQAAGQASGQAAGQAASAPTTGSASALLAQPAAPAAPAADSAQNTPESSQPSEDQAEGGVISFWQLPEPVRQQLPALKITVLVYHEVPGNRFILMGGKRYKVGDPVGNNLRLLAIQRDRAIFRYGAYRFFVTQR